MNDITKTEQKARKFLKQVVHIDANNPSFFVYYMLKTGQGELINKLDSLNLKSKEIKLLVDGYLKSLETLKQKVSKIATMSGFTDDIYSEFVNSTLSNPLYFVPIEKIDEKLLSETQKKNYTNEELIKILNLNPSMYNISITSVDSCLQD